jgi:hypothetical protein
MSSGAGSWPGVVAVNVCTTRTMGCVLTDTRLALDAVVREVRDLDDDRMGAAASAQRPGLLAAIDGGGTMKADDRPGA